MQTTTLARAALKQRLPAFCVLLALLGLGAWRLLPRGTPSAEPAASTAEALPPPATSASSAQAGAAMPAPSKVLAAATRPPPTTVYAIVLDGLAQQTPQALAAARQLRNLCMASYAVLHKEVAPQAADVMAALTSLQGGLRPLPGETPELSQRRQQALEIIQRHCGALARDPQAMHRDEIRRAPKSNPPGFENDLRMHLQAQDFHGAGMTLIGGQSTPVAFFDGQPWGGTSPETYVLAVHFAMWMDPRPSGRMAAQLGVAIECLRNGHCTDQDLALHVLGDGNPLPTPAMLAQANALAPRIFAAMKAVRMEAFLPPADMRR